ncbi:hypothetical protein [Nocardioides sp. R-C-SC26]|uniref:hypothetical protein n=1 Tax=Nocardioides sp. R-C-SC26 TaxID=2870414 RepID=UPI001E43324E|nr:hypothetical protein [Nocardioides sp. R-C-SC26]
MNTQLEQLRDHSRHMAGRRHAATCPPKRERPSGVIVGRARWCGSGEPHDRHDWEGPDSITWECAGICGGCMPVRERALWVQIADEIDAHLTRDVAAAEADPDLSLFGLLAEEAVS